MNSTRTTNESSARASQAFQGIRRAIHAFASARELHLSFFFFDASAMPSRTSPFLSIFPASPVGTSREVISTSIRALTGMLPIF